jgi:HAD superfamily hydrolase (TIGR01509 family)
MKIKGAIFDMDGTLIDSLMFWEVFWEEFGNKYLQIKDFKPDIELDSKVKSMIFSESIIYIKKHFALDLSTDDFVEYASNLVRYFYTQRTKVKPGVKALLKKMRDKGIPTCLASATDMRYIMIAVDELGLREYFDHIISCADIGIGKEKPDIFLKGATLLGIDKGDIYVFEDSFVALETAKKIGFNTVGVYDKRNLKQDRVMAASDIYIGAGDDLSILIDKI